MKRVKYNKASLESAVEAAERLQSNHTLYIFATHSGYQIDKAKPPFGQKYIKVGGN